MAVSKNADEQRPIESFRHQATITNHLAGTLQLKDTVELLRGIPKAELHLHLGGTLSTEAFFPLYEKYKSKGQSPYLDTMRIANISKHPVLENFLRTGRGANTFEEFLDFTDFDGFLDLYGLTTCYVRDADDIALLARAAVDKLIAQNVRYVELDVLFGGHKVLNYSAPDLGPVLDDVAKNAPIEVRWIAGLPRFLGPEESTRVVKELVAADFQSLVGVTMGGPEKEFPHAEHAEAFRLAAEGGLRLSCHAGEADGPQSVWSAINDLNVERIGHGVRSTEDPRLVGYLAEEGIPLEVCPTSNVMTGIFKDVAHHPIRDLYEAGVPVTLNSDDPAFFGSDLNEEYVKLHRLGWTEEELLELVENGFAAAFTDEETIENLLDEVQSYVEAVRGEDSALPDAISVPSMPNSAETDPLHDAPAPNYETGSVEDLIVRVPKAELHLHLAGTMTGPVFAQLLDKYRSWSPDLIGDRDAQAMERYPALQPLLDGDLNALRSTDLFEFDDMEQFGVTVRVLNSFMRDLDDVALVAAAAIENLERQNVVYAEFSFDLERFSRLGASMVEVGKRLDAIAKSAPIGIRWLADPGRDIGPDQAMGLVERLIDARFESLAGISLSGRERDFPPRLFADMFKVARDAGLKTTIHAGELLGSDSIWHVINELEVDRIGHGIRAADDPQLIDALADDAIPLEMCPTANVATGMYATLATHPIHDLFGSGVTITLSSDYPTYFGTDLVGEYLALHETGWAKNDLLEVIENGFLMAFIPDEDADHYLNRVHAIWEEE